ncbi:hypothetical protein BsWGS_28065 [Bradybaena similaris]
MDNTNSDGDKLTTGERCFRQTAREEDKQADTGNSDDSMAHLNVTGLNQHPGSGQLMSVDSSKDPNNNISSTANFSARDSRSSPARDLSSEQENPPWVDACRLLRAPKKRHAVKHNMDRTNKFWRRPKCGRNLFGRDQDAGVSTDRNEKPYQEEVEVSVTLDKGLQSSHLSGDESFSLTDVEMSAKHLADLVSPCVYFCCQHSSSTNSNKAEADSSSDNQSVCDNAGEDCDNVNDRSEEASRDLTSNEEYLKRHAAGSLSSSPATNDGNNNPRGFAEGETDAEYDRPRLLPEHYVAPRRQRRLPSSIRARMTSMRRRRLSFTSSDDEISNQQGMTEDADLQLSDEVNSLHALSPCLESRLSNQNIRRSLFDNNNNSLRKSLYTLIQSQNNSRISNLSDEDAIQFILNAVFGPSSCGNICSRQWRSDSDVSEDLGSSNEDCNTVNDSSDNDSSELSSDEDYWRSAADSPSFLPNSMLSSLPSDMCCLRLCQGANQVNDNLGYCATESSDNYNENAPMYNNDDGGCNNANDSAENDFPVFTSSEDYSISQAADTPPMSPVTSDNRNNLMDLADSDAEYNGRPYRPEQCAAPRRQRIDPVSRSTRRAPMCRRRICFDDCDEETNNQEAISRDASVDSDAGYNRRPHRPEQCVAPRRQRRAPVSRQTRRASLCRRRLCFDDCDKETDDQGAMSGDTCVVSQSDTNSPIIHGMFTDNNKYMYTMAPSYDQSGQSRQMDTASTQSTLNCFFNLPICDNWSSQSSLNSNASNETDSGHSLSQPSPSTESGTRLSNNDNHNSFILATGSTRVFNYDSHSTCSLPTDSTRVSNNDSHNSCSLATDSTRVFNNDSHNSSSLTMDTEDFKHTGSPSNPPCPSHNDYSLH